MSTNKEPQPEEVEEDQEEEVWSNEYEDKEAETDSENSSRSRSSSVVSRSHKRRYKEMNEPKPPALNEPKNCRLLGTDCYNPSHEYLLVVFSGPPSD